MILSKEEHDALFEALESFCEDRDNYIDDYGLGEYDAGDLWEMVRYYSHLSVIARKGGQSRLQCGFEGLANKVQGFIEEAKTDA